MPQRRHVARLTLDVPADWRPLTSPCVRCAAETQHGILTRYTRGETTITVCMACRRSLGENLAALVATATEPAP